MGASFGCHSATANEVPPTSWGLARGTFLLKVTTVNKFVIKGKFKQKTDEGTYGHKAVRTEANEISTQV